MAQVDEKNFTATNWKRMIECVKQGSVNRCLLLTIKLTKLLFLAPLCALAYNHLCDKKKTIVTGLHWDSLYFLQKCELHYFPQISGAVSSNCQKYRKEKHTVSTQKIELFLVPELTTQFQHCFALENSLTFHELLKLRYATTCCVNFFASHVHIPIRF